LSIATSFDLLNEGFLILNHEFVDLDVALNRSDVSVHAGNSRVGKALILLSVLHLGNHHRLLHLVHHLLILLYLRSNHGLLHVRSHHGLLILFLLLVKVLVHGLSTLTFTFPTLDFTQSVHRSDRHDPSKYHKRIVDRVSPGCIGPFKPHIPTAHGTKGHTICRYKQLFKNDQDKGSYQSAS
jgi:hypothetical protein